MLTIVQSIPDSVHNVSYYLGRLEQDNSNTERPNIKFTIDNFSVDDVYRAILSLSNSGSFDVYYLCFERGCTLCC